MYRLAIVMLVGCGSQDLTCPLLAEPTNCWATAAAAAAACIPMHAMPATLAADRTSCSYSDGTRVVFDTPLPSSTFDLTQLGLTFQAAGGAQCARFLDTFHNRMELTAGGQTVVSELQSDRTFQLHCGDGTTYEAKFDLLFTCQPPARAPTDGFDLTSTMFSFSISSVSTPGTLITCM